MKGVGDTQNIELIECYLKIARDFIKANNYQMNAEDKRNLTQLGISYKEAIEIVTSLTHRDYVKGPEVDHKIPEQDIYIFGFWLEEIELYIKLTFRITRDLFIMSFHEALYPMNYPFK